MGPFENWPTGSGFEYFYGFIGGEAHQYYPALYEGTTPVEPWGTPEEGYHLMGDMTDKAINWVRQQKSLMPDKPFFAYFAPGATHAPHHVPKDWVGQVQGPLRRRLGRAARGDLRAPEAARRHPRRCGAHPAPCRDPRVGRDAGGAQAGAAPADGGLRGLPRVHRPPRRPAVRRARGPRGVRQHARLLRHRRQRRLGGGHAERHVQRDDQLQRRRRDRDAGVHDRAPRRASAGRTATTTTRSAGRTRWTRPTSGPSRSPRTSAARATARSCSWPAGIEAKGEVRTQFAHVIDVAPTVLEAAGLTRADLRPRDPADADPGHQHALLVRRRRGAPSATRRSTSRCSATARSTTRAGPR